MAKPQDRLTPFEERLGQEVSWIVSGFSGDRLWWAWDFNVRAEMNTQLLYKLAQLAQKAPLEDIERFLRDAVPERRDERPIDIDDPRFHGKNRS